MDDYKEYLDKSRASSDLKVESIVDSYQRSVARQINGSIENSPQLQ
jgi:hypothetical protein